MFYFNTLNLNQISGGNQVKQGDFGSTFTYKLADEKNKELDVFDQKTAYVNLVLKNNIVFSTTVIVDDSTVTFNIDKAIPTGLYFLEIKIDSYIFPSDRQTIILVTSGAVAYDLKDLIPNYDTNMTISSILSDLSQKGIDISDLKTKMNAIYNNALADHAEIETARGGKTNLGVRLDAIGAKEASDYTELNSKIATNTSNISSTNARLDNFTATAGNGNSSELSDIRVGDDGITYDLAGNAVRTQFKNIKKDLARFVAKKDLISGFLNANITSDEAGGYKLTADATSLTLFFQVVSGKTYTVNKGYSMSAYPRLAYSATVPTIGGVVTGYLDFSANANFKEFTANQNGYAVIKISYPNDVATLVDVQNSVFVYEGSYDSGISKNTVDLSNVRMLDGMIIGDLNKKLETITKISIVSGYLNAQVTASAITKATDNTKLAVYFPVKKGMTYTLDKKIATNHTRVAYTSNVPNYGDVPSNFFMANNGAVLSNWTFTSAQDGYCIVWMLDTTSNTSITFDQIKNNLIAYEGYYDQSYAINSTKINAVNIDKTFYCGPTRSLTTLKAGLEEATKYMDSTLYVDPGTYDLIQEFGQSWFDNLGTTTMVGLQLKNRVHVIFSPQSKVISHYTGTNANAMSLYSPFNAGPYGFTIENLTLECSNCRYGIHDERNGATEQYKAHYINCSMKIDNSKNGSWGSKHNIGGGLGTNAEIIIENCTFESDDASIRWGVSYHITNRIATDPAYKCKVTIKDNYFKTGGISLNTVPNAVESTVGISDYVISNNSFPVKYAGTDAQGIFSDLQYSSNIMAWNNNFRG